MMVRHSSPQVEKYDFGRLRHAGKEYDRDVILYADPAAGGAARVQTNGWRKEGHRLDKDDLKEVVKEKPEVLVVGTGYYGRMVVPQETLEFLNRLGIEVHTGETQEAVKKYNELLTQGESASGGKDIRKVVAALHLTC